MEARLQALEMELDHRPPLPQAGHGIEPHLQFIKVQEEDPVR